MVRGPHRGRAQALALILVLGAPAARAQTPAQVKRAEAAIGVEEKLGALAPQGLVLEEAEGRPLALAALAGRPLLLTFNYTSCARLCSVQLAGLARGLRDLGWQGEAFSVATVSVDPAEKVSELRRHKEIHLYQAGGGAGLAGAWHFLRGAEADVAALADAVGFKYRYVPETGEFQHQATLVVLTADGRVSGYLHGVTYEASALRTALDRAAAGRIATAEEQQSLGGFLLSCMGLDPDDPLPLALKVMRAGGVAIALSLAGFLLMQVRRGARRVAPPPPSPPPPRTSP